MSIPFSTAQFEKKPNPKMPATTVRLDKLDATQLKLDPKKFVPILTVEVDD